ncbi:MAG: DNA-binding protein [Candidatus Omnitrophota bacterium]
MTMILIACCITTHAEPISSIELIDDAVGYDGKTVAYEGEVIGDIMARGEHVWVNVKNATTAIGIWAPKGLVKNIANKGAYNQIGDFIEVKGTFNRSCKEHGGDLDIHADSLVILKEGYKITVPIDKLKVRYAILFGMILIFVSIWKVYRKLIYSFGQ